MHLDDLCQGIAAQNSVRADEEVAGLPPALVAVYPLQLTVHGEGGLALGQLVLRASDPHGGLWRAGLKRRDSLVRPRQTWVTTVEWRGRKN
ncbi:hypothetical protein HDA40_001835 [Hamadaea flava]|uniref:Uncharacterized protein n=1 Tax=Hamadaea flava TaxID=1742688 RepID=A0ABV8LNE9_9ACTN|nr:hypothetical protein [Hamadaea flava]MCP2323328.1 hypothetical protein [Hamadaea flava]